jgi:transposase
MFSRDLLIENEFLKVENGYLKKDIAEFHKLLNKLALKNEELSFQIKILKDLAKKDSSNSSIPPSKALFKATNKKKKSEKKIGGQVGHPGSFRPLVDASQVTKIVKCYPEKSCECGGEIKLRPRKKPARHQIFELTEIRPIITEYQKYRGVCNCCKKKAIAPLPKGVGANILGPRAMAFIGQAGALYHLTKSQTQMMLKDSLGIEVAISTISNVEKRISEYFENIYNELGKKVMQAKHLHIDETGHKNQGKKGFAWCFVNENIFYLKLAMSRGAKVLTGVIGESFKGKITTDRYSAYNVIEAENRQVCWAHLLRDFRKFANSEHQEVANIGGSLLKNTERIFELLKAVKFGIIKREKFDAQIEDIKKKIETMLFDGSLRKKYKNFGGSCANIWKLRDALWNFLDDPGLEATNNLAERSIRPFVIKRKLSFGTWSDRGDRFLERMMSVIPMIIKSGKSVLETVTKIIKESLLGKAVSLSLIA